MSTVVFVVEAVGGYEELGGGGGGRSGKAGSKSTDPGEALTRP